MHAIRLPYFFEGVFMLLFCGSCSSDPIEELLPGKEGNTEKTDLYHDYKRQYPYPKAENEIFLNPPPLIVPNHLKTGALLQFSLSRDAHFDEAETQESKAVHWCMYNPHKTLENGTWYWRFRSVSAEGKTQPWSDTYPFEITEDIPQFVTPTAETFFQNLPIGHPRLYCFLDSKMADARKEVSAHPEYKSLLSRANRAVQMDFSNIASYYKSEDDLKNQVEFLFQAYTMTLEKTYAKKMLEILRLMLSRPPTESELFASNFISTGISAAHIKIYDLLYAQLSAGERREVEKLLMKVSRFYYKVHPTKQENNLYDSHFWQQNMRVLFQAAYMLYDKPAYTAEISPILEYYYEIWSARAPASGYNRDGVWHNSSSYFINNVETLSYIPSLFSYLTRSDFLKHPWFQQAGRSLVYTWPAGSRSCGFGDGSEIVDTPHRVRIAFADFIARHTGDGYAQWYAGQGVADLREDYVLRLDRMVNPLVYETEQPNDMDKMIWYKDAGEVVMHSDLAHRENNLSLAFRSSRYGSTQHTFANQNAFNLLYKGADVFRNSGYYLKYASPHHIMSYRHTRAHNSILVNGIGQSFTPKAYGNIVRGIQGDHISYCLGDASRAYTDIGDLEDWNENFEEAGIEQTPENGFGATPLTKYLRHVWMLHPHIIVIYDELKASEPVRWDWLLHSPTAFFLEPDGYTFHTVNEEKGFAAQVQLFSGKAYRFSQTDQFRVPPSSTPDPKHPNQWHLNATVEKSSGNRFLSILQVYDRGERPSPIDRKGNEFKIEGWVIQAELNPDNQPSVTLVHAANNVVFNYGTGDVILPDRVYQRKHSFSSVLYDEYKGVVQLSEETDFLPKHTRAISTRENNRQD